MYKKTLHENKVQPKVIIVRRKPIQQVKKATIVTVAATPNTATGNGSISENTQEHNRKRKQLFQRARIDEVYIKTVEATKTYISNAHGDRQNADDEEGVEELMLHGEV